MSALAAGHLRLRRELGRDAPALPRPQSGRARAGRAECFKRAGQAGGGSSTVGSGRGGAGDAGDPGDDAEWCARGDEKDGGGEL